MQRLNLRNSIPIALFLFCAIGWYLNTGTLAPYAATSKLSIFEKNSGLLVNIDHEGHMDVMEMLEGNTDGWQESVVLRRPLHAWICFPLNRLLDYAYSGSIVNLFLYLLASLWLWIEIANKDGNRTGLYCLALLCTYPGFTYWAGLPYCYGIIAPGSILCYLIQNRISENLPTYLIASYSFIGGIVFLGYDLYAIFLPSFILSLLINGLWQRIFIVAPCTIIPLSIYLYWLRSSGIPLENSNSEVYRIILQAYVNHGIALPDFEFLRQLLSSLLWSNFLFLPIGFIFTISFTGFRFIRFSDLSLILATSGLFFFLNLAPQYDGWQMRGDYMNRLYQPAFVAMIIVLSRFAANYTRFGPSLLSAVVLLQSAVMFSGALNISALHACYEKFYPHDRPGVYAETLNQIGKRPIGFNSPKPLTKIKQPTLP